jgi:aspartate aminotransferase-like enzyme
VDQPAYPASRDPAFNLTGGPAGATPATLAALGRPVLHHLDPAFGALYQRTAELLQQAFGTRESPVILPGEAVVGLQEELPDEFDGPTTSRSCATRVI